MFVARYIFTLVSFLIFNRSTSSVELVPAIENTNIKTAESAIRTTANTLFYTLGVRKIQQKPRLHHYAIVHNYFISKTLQSYDNVKEIIRLTKVDKSNKTENTADFIALINEILNEDNVLKLQNIIMGEGSRTGYDIDSEIAKLKFLKSYHREQLKTSLKRNESNLGDQDETLEWENITKVEGNDDNIDKIPFWSEDTILPQRRIFNGKRTKIKHFPFMASIQIFGKFTCGGSIIKSDLVITAASCLQLAWNNRFYRENPAFLSVRVGSSFYEVGGENIEALEIYFYPSYDPKLLRNNVAIIRLIRKIRMKRHKVQKIEIADSFGDYVGNILVVGWGAYATGNHLHGPWEDRMRSSALHYYPLEECQDIYSTEYVTQRNFCAGFMSVGGGACNRDVGGPGIISGQLAGVISFGAPQCGRPDAPTVFTKLSYYTDWIEEIMEQNVSWTIKRTTLKPFAYTRHLEYSQTEQSNEPLDMGIIPVTSQHPEVLHDQTFSLPVTDIVDTVYLDTVEKNKDLTRQQDDNIGENRIIEEKGVTENQSYHGESDINDVTQAPELRITVMKHKELSTVGYEIGNDSNQKQTTDNTSYISKNPSQESGRVLQMQITNSYKPEYPQTLSESERNFELNATKYPNLINKLIYPEILINNQDLDTTKSELSNPEESTTSIIDFTLNLEKQHKNLYPEVFTAVLDKTKQSHEIHSTKIQSQESQTVGNTQSKTILTSDYIQTTPIKLKQTAPLLDDLLKETQALYQLVYTENPTNPFSIQKDEKLDTLDKESIQNQETDKAANLEPLIEAQKDFATNQKLPLNYNEEVKMAYQQMQKQKEEEEEKLADIIAYQLLLSKSDEETDTVNQEEPLSLDPIKTNYRANYIINSTNQGLLKQSQIGEIKHSQSQEISSFKHKKGKTKNWTHSQAEKNKNLEKQYVFTQFQNEDISDNQKNSTQIMEDMNLANQRPSTQGSKIYTHGLIPAEESLYLTNLNSPSQVNEKDEQDNQTDSMLDEEDANSETLTEDEEDNLDYQANYSITNEDGNYVNLKSLKKNYEEDYQTDSTLVDKNITYKEKLTKDENEVKLFNQADSKQVDDLLNLETLKEGLEGRLDNQTDSAISGKDIQLTNQKSFARGGELLDFKAYIYDDQEASLKLKKDMKSINSISSTQTRELFNSAHKENLSYQEHLSQAEDRSEVADLIHREENSDLSQTENRAQQYEGQNIIIQNANKPMHEKVLTQVMRNDVLINKDTNIARQVLQYQQQTSSMKPSYLLTTAQKDFDTPNQTHFLNDIDFFTPTQKVSFEQKKKADFSKIANEMDTEMKKFLENNLDKTVLSLLYPTDIKEGDPLKNIDRSVTILLDYGDIVDSKTASTKNPTQPKERSISDEVSIIRKQTDKSVETFNKYGQQETKTINISQTGISQVPPVHERHVALFTTPAKVKKNEQKQERKDHTNVSDELYYSIEGTDNEDKNNDENVEEARRAMRLGGYHDHSKTINSEEDNTTEANMKMNSKEADAIKRNILDYINI